MLLHEEVMPLQAEFQHLKKIEIKMLNGLYNYSAYN